MIDTGSGWRLRVADVITDRISKIPGVCGGRTCIAGHRIRVMDIVLWYEGMGLSADEIVSHFPTLTLSDVHAALAYYHDHTQDIQEEVRQEQGQAAGFRRQLSSPLQEKFDRLRGQDSR